MATNLLEMISGAVTPAHVQGLARHLGEKDTAVQGGIGALLPVVLGGMASKSATPSGATSLFSMFNGSDVDSDAVGRFGSGLETDRSGAMLQTGNSMLSGLFGSDRIGGLSSALSGITGMRTSSAGSLAALLMPMVFGLMKRFIGSNRMDARGLSSLLAGQKDYLAGKLDPRLTSAAGLGTPDHLLEHWGGARTAGAGAATATMDRRAAGTEHAYRTHDAATMERSGGMRRWLPWVIVAAIAALLLGQYAARRNHHYAPNTSAPTAMAPTEPSGTATTPPVASTQPSTTVPPVASTQPSTTAPPTTTAAAQPQANGAASTTATLGAGPAQLPAKVYFDTGRADLSSQGHDQIQTIAAMLASNPDMHVDIRGYTDKSGSHVANGRLGQRRATAVKEALQTAGVAPDRMTTKTPATVEDGNTTTDPQARRVEITASS